MWRKVSMFKVSPEIDIQEESIDKETGTAEIEEERGQSEGQGRGGRQETNLRGRSFSFAKGLVEWQAHVEACSQHLAHTCAEYSNSEPYTFLASTLPTKSSFQTLWNAFQKSLTVSFRGYWF